MALMTNSQSDSIITLKSESNNANSTAILIVVASTMKEDEHNKKKGIWNYSMGVEPVSPPLIPSYSITFKKNSQGVERTF